MGGGYSWVVKNSKCQFLSNLSFGDGRKTALEYGILGKMSKKFAMPCQTLPCISESLSHTTCMETNQDG